MKSVWALDRSELASFPQLEGELDVEVVIVGGGATGLATALMLCDAGTRVAVLEARQLGSGSTGNSTGNLYSTLSQGLSPLAKKWDVDTVRHVVERRRRALDRIQGNVERLEIHCDYQRRPLYLGVAQTDNSNRKRLEEEYRLTQAAGLDSRLLDDPRDLRLPFSKVLRIEQQAQFNPLQYCDGLVKALKHCGASLFENSPAISINPDDGSVSTAKGVVRAGHIVLATHTPKGINMLQAEMEPYREHGLAAPLLNDEGFAEPGIYWMLDSSHSLRSYRAEGRDYLITVGGKYKTGKNDKHDYWQDLENYDARYFSVDKSSHRWSAQQYQSADLLPYIGLSGHDNVYVATGYAADGLVWSEVAAQIISQHILGRPDHDGISLFNPRRFTPSKSAKGWLEANAKVARHLSTDHFSLEKVDDLSQLVPGEGRVVKVQGESYAAYRSPEGVLSAVSPVCPHMKCIVNWNQRDQSWDCPCHGSRFDISGAVLEGPALEGLEPRELPAKR